MRRHWCVKYAVTLLASTALTFHLLYSASTEDKRNSPRQPPRWVVLPDNVTVHQGTVPLAVHLNFTMTADQACSGFDPSRLRLLVFVACRLNNVEKRQAIRDTWGLRMLQAAHNFRLIFLVGKMVEEQALQDEIEIEGIRYGDIVQVDMQESFRNLGLKSVSGLRWSAVYCPDADYVTKTDDDILLRVPNLIESLRPGEDDNVLLCHENQRRKILRHQQVDLPLEYHKYQVTESELPGVYYPPYCSGAAYVASRLVRDRLIDACSTTPVFFIEDVHVTGFCRQKANVEIRSNPGISLRPPLTSRQAPCSFREGRVISQELSVDQMRTMWAEINTRGFFCPKIVGFAKL